jgi:Protein of unknown function with PCYCGC motif
MSVGMSRRRFVRSLFIGGAAVSLGGWSAACGTTSNANPVPSGTVVLPQLPPDVTVLYRYIEANQAIAMKVPCYCGCGQSVGHRSLRDCFFNATGQYDAHASGCEICLTIAQQTEQFSKQGMDVATIRARIDQQFSQYGPSTKTQ